MRAPTIRFGCRSLRSTELLLIAMMNESVIDPQSLLRAPLDPRDYAPSQLLSLTASLGIPEGKMRKLLSEAIGRGRLEPAHLVARGQLPRSKGDYFGELPRLQLEKSVRSKVDGFEKLLFRTDDGLPLETVLIPLHKEGAVSICLSSQVGCVMACDFCATSRMSSRRNLRCWEIVDQFLQARDIVRAQGRRVTGAVFMGMGEPFLNYDRVLAAADVLRFPLLDAIAAKAITISTVGLVREIDRFTAENRPFRLSISLGAATDAKRAVVVPVAARTPIAEVIAAARRHAEDRRDRVMLAYVCIGGFNVGEDDAKALGELIGTTPVRLDLIDVTDPTGKYRRPSENEMTHFRDSLSRYLGQPVVRRYSGGADINAACGTLAGAETTAAS